MTDSEPLQKPMIRMAKKSNQSSLYNSIKISRHSSNKYSDKRLVSVISNVNITSQKCEKTFPADLVTFIKEIVC